MDSEGPDVQSDQGLPCPHLPEGTFSHGIAQMSLSSYVASLADLVLRL